jgi:N6-adenosine-specific RNA methylase IME4
MKYKTIIADPPWEQKSGPKMSGQYVVIDGEQQFDFVSLKSADLPYVTMSVDDICSMPIKDMADKDAMLFLWVTNKHLPNAFKVIEAWGFKYSTCLTWAKKPMGGGLGGTFRIGHEHLIYATRGKAGAKGKVKGTVFDVKREYEGGYPCHSRKPKFFLDMIDELSHGPKLELFARRERDGWDVYGNEVENSIEI